MSPTMFIVYMFFLIKNTKRYYWAQDFEAFWKNPDSPRLSRAIQTLSSEIRTEMKLHYRSRKWLEGEKQWTNFSPDEVVYFLRRYDARNVDAKRKTKKTKKSARNKKRSN